MKRNLTGPPIMEDEILAATRKLKSGKATGLASVSVELLVALGDYGIDKIKTLPYATKSMTQVRLHQTSPNLYY